ncbi:SIMPL domain-containing protein [Allorhizobium undicola]|uniref:SIMPL domain-containing protein n=1 Tax=Allorhizobium undicola TaxID=78527 RepID=UPI003D34212E
MNSIVSRRCLVILAGCWLAGPAFAQEGREARPVLNVVGEGQVSVAPDMAIVQLGVVSEGKSADEALAANSRSMAKVLQALKDGGLAERDLQTSGFQIMPLYRQDQPDKPPQAPSIEGYSVSNGLTVRVRDLQKLGGVIDRSVKLGVNQGGSVEFTNDKPDEALDRARKAAVEDAMRRARILAEAAGVKLGPAISIQESGTNPVAAPMAMKAAMRNAAAEAVPIAAGENSYRVTVSMAFSLSP